MESPNKKTYLSEITSLAIERIYKNVEHLKFHQYPFVMVWKTEDNEYETCGHQTLDAVMDDYYQTQEESNGWELIGVYRKKKPLKINITTHIQITE